MSASNQRLDNNQAASTQQGSRVSVPELDAILGQKIPVLDDGFVRVVDYMGGDASIVQAARVSYGAGTKKVSEDRGLIRYLMRHWHSTPFEMCEIKLHVRVPMDCWRQWIRHRTANVNEYSTRYSVAIDGAQQTPEDSWRRQAKNNKQGSGGCLDFELGKKLTAEEAALQTELTRVYQARLDAGVAREQARKDLPLSTYTEAYWKVDLHNLLHFLRLRMDTHAQLEIRDYANAIGEQIVAKWCPHAWQSFLDYRQHAVALTAIDTRFLAVLNIEGNDAAQAFAKESGLLRLSSKTKTWKPSREGRELAAKLSQMNLSNDVLL